MVLTNLMLSQILSDVKTGVSDLMDFMAVGNDTTTPAASDTVIGKEVFRDAPDEVDTSVANAVTSSLRIATTEANSNAIAVVGVISANDVQIDSCDVTTNWTDSADMTLSTNSNTYRENGIALNLTKDAGASATASTSKTTTSADFTSKTFSMWLYIVDATMLAKLATTDCLTIRFGSDASNYYQWTKDAADLAVGWNYITSLTSSNADSTTGSPSLTAMDYTYIGITATGAAITWSAGDLIMDDIKLTSGTLYTEHTFTAINKTDDIQVYLDTQITILVTEGS